MRGEKTDRNVRILEDSKIMSTRELAKKYSITPARVHVILTRMRTLQLDQPDRIVTAIQQTEDRLMSISTEIEMTLRDLRTLRRLIKIVNESSN